MGWSPPTKGTVIISFLLLLVGIVIYILSYYGILNFAYDNIIAFSLACVAWLLMFLGVKMKGL